MDNKKEINKVVRKLNKIFADIPDSKKDLVAGLIQNAAFMEVTLKNLQSDVVENGAMIHVTSGNGFETMKDNPAQKAYTTMIARYSNVINQLSALLPDTKTDSLIKAGEKLSSEVAKGKKAVDLSEFC